MRQRRQTPEEWQAILNGMSLRQLSATTGVSPTAITRLVHRDGESSWDTIEAVIGKIGHREFVEEWARGAARHSEGRRLPDAARELSGQQWDVVERLIAVMADPYASGRHHLRTVDERRAARQGKRPSGGGRRGDV